MNPVQLLEATAGMAANGMGSHFYVGNYRVILDNIAYQKVVGVWGRQFGTANWSFYPCHYVNSVPGNLEIWEATIGDKLDQFTIKYVVAGKEHWDNNEWHDYLLDVEAAKRVEGVGTRVIDPHLLGEGGGFHNGHLIVNVAVQNLAYHKQVGIRYTTDGWKTKHEAFGSYVKSYPPRLGSEQPQVETWVIEVPINQTLEYYLFYNVTNTTFWDNNFGRNYVVYA